MASSPSLEKQARLPATRPKGIAYVVVIEVLVGALGIAGGIGSLSAKNLPQPQGLGFLQVLAPVLPIVLIAIGAFFIVSSYGLWRGFGWAWTATIVFEVIHIIADIGFIASRSFALDKIIGLVVILAILFYLTRRNVRAYFGKGRPAA